MKRVITVLTHASAILLLCLITGSVLAVCVTPDVLKKQVTDIVALPEFASNATGNANSKFVSAILLGRTGINPLSVTAGNNIDKPTATEQLDALNSDPIKGNWQKLPSALKTTLTPQEKIDLNKQMNLVQNWASYGELVVAIDEGTTTAADRRIVLVVPGTAAPATGTSTLWDDVSVPHIAYAGAKAGAASGTYDKKADVLMSVIFENPTSISFFRYKN